MFNWEDTTIINNLYDLGYAGVTSATGATDIAKHPRFWVDTTDTTNPVLRISHSLRIAKSNVKFIYKRAWEVPEYAVIKFDMKNAIKALGTDNSGIERLSFAYEVVGSNDVIYVDAYSRHKVPFNVEFPVSTSDKAADLATKVVRMINKYQVALKGSKIFDASVDGDFVVITAKDEYLKVASAMLEYYNEKVNSYDCCTAFGDFEKNSDGIVVSDGKPGNGTYRQLTKDFWLPTDAHRAWESPFDDEAPMPGANYNEYTITMCVERPGLGGQSAVGLVIASETIHTFYVLDNGAADETNPSKAFETALKAVADVTTTTGESDSQVTTYNNVKTADKDYDDKMIDKATLETATTADKIIEVEKTAQGTNKTDTKELADPKGLTKGKRQPTA